MDTERITASTTTQADRGKNENHMNNKKQETWLKALDMDSPHIAREIMNAAGTKTNSLSNPNKSMNKTKSEAADNTIKLKELRQLEQKLKKKEEQLKIKETMINDEIKNKTNIMIDYIRLRWQTWRWNTQYPLWIDRLKVYKQNQQMKIQGDIIMNSSIEITIKMKVMS